MSNANTKVTPELELLRGYLDRELNNVFCYSATYLMDSPKKGYEKEFAEAAASVKVLEGLIKRLEAE